MSTSVAVKLARFVLVLILLAMSPIGVVLAAEREAEIESQPIVPGNVPDMGQIIGHTEPKGRVLVIDLNSGVVVARGQGGSLEGLVHFVVPFGEYVVQTPQGPTYIELSKGSPVYEFRD